MYSSIKKFLLYLPFLLVIGCSSSSNSTSTISGNSAVFDPTTNNIPMPNILATATASDPITQYNDPVTGVVGRRPANTPLNPLEALAYVQIREMANNPAVSGVNAPIYIQFSAPVDPASVTAANVKVFQLAADSASPTATENNHLGFTDVTGMFKISYSTGSTNLFLFPNFPLLPGTRYLFVVSNRVKDAATGSPIVSSMYFNALKSPYTLTGELAPLEQIRANFPATGSIQLSGYAKVMDDLILSAATTTITSRND